MVEDFDFEFYSEVDPIDPGVEHNAEHELRQLAEGHTDLVGAHVSIRQPVHAATNYLYEVNIVAYLRPENVDASAEDDTVEGAMKEALSGITRQVREKRERLGKPWKRVQE